ncbi:MAG: hypothetical protein EAZ78_09625 [Oscillatoriales cyanobacterium]|nr:MAG: hypothetical protein EAZ78_09625 [Oscillatoriales cyanobacterium]
MIVFAIGFNPIANTMIHLSSDNKSTLPPSPPLGGKFRKKEEEPPPSPPLGGKFRKKEEEPPLAPP